MNETPADFFPEKRDVPETVQGVFPSDDRTPIFYEASGNPDGPTLLFCNGLVCRREHWRHQLAHFSATHRLITFDYRGHGRSGMPTNEKNLTLDWCARDAAALIRQLELSDVVVFGHSMGVPIAVKAALKAADSVRGTVLVCGSVRNPFKGMFYSDRLDMVFKGYSKLFEIAPNTTRTLWKQFTKRTFLNEFFTSQLGFNPRLSEDLDVKSYMDGVHETPPETFWRLMRDYTAYDGREDLTKVSCPSLVLAGTEDYITPMYLQEEMAAHLPKGILETVPMGSHNAHTDLPDLVNQRIERFLQTLE